MPPSPITAVSTPTPSSPTTPSPSTSARTRSAAPATFVLSLAPFHDATHATPPAHFERLERHLGEGGVIRIGRQVRGEKDENVLTPGADEGGEGFRGVIGDPGSGPGSVVTAAGVFKAKKVASEMVQCIWFKSKVVSRGHAEMWCKDGQMYLKDTASSSGTFLNKLRLSPSGKESRPYVLRNGDIIQLGIDYQGRVEDVYKAIIMKIQITPLHHHTKTSTPRFRTALRLLLSTITPTASLSSSPSSPSPLSPNSKKPKPSSAPVDCCICLASISQLQALFLAPCSHCYHYKCIKNLLETGNMFQCPMCRQVANLDASVSMESLSSIAGDDLDSGSEDDEERGADDEDSGNIVEGMGDLTLEGVQRGKVAMGRADGTLKETRNEGAGWRDGAQE